MESSSSFVQHYEFLDVTSCSHFSDFLSDGQVRKQSAMLKRGQEATRTKAHQWRKRDHAWWRVTRGVRESLHEVGDLESIRRIPMKEKK